MGFPDEEIELGFSTICQEGDTEKNELMMRNMFPEDQFSRQSHPMDQKNWCNSLMRSLSNNPSFPETLMMQAASNSIDEEDAIIKDIVHVLCSSSSSSPNNNYCHYYDDDHQNMSSGTTTTCVVHPGDGVIISSSAFKRYNREDNNSLGKWRQRQSKLKRLFEFFRGLHNAMRVMSINEATPSRLHHMISERRRRQKLNHNFQALAALLPPPTKKDQASILTRAKETLRCLRADIEELTRRMQQLKAEIEAKKLILGSTSSDHEDITKRDHWPKERLSVGVSSVSENVEERMIEVQVSVRGTITNKVDHILIGVLEFLKGLDHNVVTLISMAANTHTSQVAPSNIHELALSLRIEEGTEWDKAAFLEALRRVVADLVQ